MRFIIALSLFACNNDVPDVNVHVVPPDPVVITNTETIEVPAVDADGDLFPAEIDCDDNNPNVHPGAQEICNEDGIDYDCDGLVGLADDDLPYIVYHDDADGDGFGNGGGHVNCYGYVDPDAVLNGDDCDDDNPSINPDADETCDGLDNDCDGLTDSGDDNVVDAKTFLIDTDGDGFGSMLDTPVLACDPPAGYSDVPPGDCDDTAGFINPDAQEICDEYDNDCDGLVNEDDPDVIGGYWWLLDSDLDGFGWWNPATNVYTCSLLVSPGPDYYALVNNSSDCNDVDPDIYPGADETCDGLDNDCDTLVDEVTWYYDGDLDGYGEIGSENVVDNSCESVEDGYLGGNPEWILVGDDCDGSDPAVNPDEFEVCGNGIDDDCDGEQLLIGATYPDQDGDGDGDTTQGMIGWYCEDAVPDGQAWAAHVDCDDTDPLVSGLLPETYGDGLDNDCDGNVD